MTEGAARTVAGRYHLLGALGRGGMGAVWRAHDTLLGRDVALKEILLPGAGDGPVDPADPVVRRALREARAAARLRHPAIVTVHDAFADAGRPWIVMELVEGRSLAEAVRDDGPMAGRRAAEIGLHVLDALGAAHREGIVHRDVKPANILLGAGRVVLTDFGIAAVDDATALTATGQMIGSPAYLAPERVNGRAATPAADLWALGVTLYAAVTGRSPFQRADVQATLAAVLTSRPDPPAPAGRLWPVVKGLLEKDPARRLTAEQARELLSAVAFEEQPSPPRPASTVWRRRVAVGAAAVLLAGAGAAIAHRYRPGTPAHTASHTPAYTYARTLLPGRPICAAVWNPAGTRYAVTSGDTGLEIFDRDGTLVRRFTVGLAPRRQCYLNDPGVYWNPAGTTVAVVGGTRIGWSSLYFFDADAGTTTVARIPAGLAGKRPSWLPTGSAVAAEKSYALVLVGTDGTVGRTLIPASLSSIRYEISSVSVSPGGDTFAVGWSGRPEDDGPLFEVRRFSDGALIRSVGRRSESGYAGVVAFDPAGALVAIGIDDFGVQVWDPAAGRRVATLRGPDGVVTDVRWSGNGRYLLVASHGQQQVHVFRAGDWTLLGTLTPHESSRRRIGVGAGGVGDDGSVFLVPQGSRGIDVYQLS